MKVKIRNVIWRKLVSLAKEDPGCLENWQQTTSTQKRKQNIFNEIKKGNVKVKVKIKRHVSTQKQNMSKSGERKI